MANLSWLDDVRQRLARQRVLPPSYVQRFVEELSDHLDDLKEESMEVDAISRLGEPEQVADAAVAAYRRRSSPGRHPTVTFWFLGFRQPYRWLPCRSLRCYQVLKSVSGSGSTSIP